MEAEKGDKKDGSTVADRASRLQSVGCSNALCYADDDYQ